MEFYNGEDLIQTATEPPFALDTKLLENGTYTITQRTYFKDGSQSEVTKVMSVQNEKLSTTSEQKSSIGTIFIGLGILLIIIMVIAIILRRKWIPYVSSIFDRFNKTDDFNSYNDVNTPGSELKVDRDEFSNPTVISPDKKK